MKATTGGWKELKLRQIEKNQESEYWKQVLGREKRTARKDTAVAIMKNYEGIELSKNSYYGSIRGIAKPGDGFNPATRGSGTGAISAEAYH